MFDYIRIPNWTIPNVIRECGRRKATKQEDIVYGVLGLLEPNNMEIEYEIGRKDALLKLIEAMSTDKRALFMICEWTKNAIPEFSDAAWGLNVDDDKCTATACIYDGSMHVTTQCADIKSISVCNSNVIDAGNNANNPRSSLQKMELTMHDGTDITGFGRIPYSETTCKLLLIGNTKESWAIKALNAENVGICVMVTTREYPNIKQGLVVVNTEKITWTKEEIAVKYTCCGRPCC